MARRSHLLPWLTLGLIVVFGFVLVRLLLLRYERGDVYPAYSTLRSDPLGARAFYEALDATGRYQVARGFHSLHRELEAKPDAVIYLGLASDDLGSFSKSEIVELDAYVKGGGRVMITLAPEAPYHAEAKKKAKPDEGKKDDDSESETPAKKDAPDADESPQTQQEKFEREALRRETEREKKETKQDVETPDYQPSLGAVWGFGWALNSAASKEKKDDEPKDKEQGDESASSGDDALPEVQAQTRLFSVIELGVPWKSALYFLRLEPDWTPIYFAKDQPVMIRRHLGKGDIVVASDSYFISNEALRNDRRPMLLSYLAGWPGHFLFDETHLGTREQEGIMRLAEKFRLEGYLIGLLVVVGLFLWRNSLPLAPPRSTDGKVALGGVISGKDSRQGLVNLLRRNIPMNEILAVCLKEWKRDVAPMRKTTASSQLTEMESVISVSESRDIVEAYHHLREINAPAKKKTSHATKP